MVSMVQKFGQKLTFKLSFTAVWFLMYKCQVEGCTSEAVWRFPNQYKGHLTSVYEMDKDEVTSYVSLEGC
jgi:hypothetical protein